MQCLGKVVSRQSSSWRLKEKKRRPEIDTTEIVISAVKIEDFNRKNDNCNIFGQNVDRRCVSKEYPQSMFWIKK